MKNKFFLLFAIYFGLTINSHANPNKTIYEITALTADEFLNNYTYEGKAQQNICSPKGKKLCKLLNILLDKVTRTKNLPGKKKLKKLALKARASFSQLDLSNEMLDKTEFADSLAIIIGMTLPFLESEEEIKEAKKFLLRLFYLKP